MLARLVGIPVIGPYLAMIFNPVSLGIIAAVAFFIWLGIHDAKIANRARSECQAEQLKKTIAEITRQRDAAQQALDDAEKRQAASDAALAKLEREGDAINQESKPLVKNTCRIPRATTKRLRNIK